MLHSEREAPHFEDRTWVPEILAGLARQVPHRPLGMEATRKPCLGPTRGTQTANPSSRSPFTDLTATLIHSVNSLPSSKQKADSKHFLPWPLSEQQPSLFSPSLSALDGALPAGHSWATGREAIAAFLHKLLDQDSAFFDIGRKNAIRNSRLTAIISEPWLQKTGLPRDIPGLLANQYYQDVCLDKASHAEHKRANGTEVAQSC